jgi:chemotaxis protein CheD
MPASQDSGSTPGVVVPGVVRDAEAPEGLPRHYVHAGQFIVLKGPAEITTILGTCVAVCLWDAEKGIGGLNHYLLPQLVNGSAASPRFGLFAFQALLAEVKRQGGTRLTAKVFGGMQATMKTLRDDLGKSNSDLAFRLLAEARIPVQAQDVGGPKGRKLIFRVPTGEAWVRYL